MTELRRRTFLQVGAGAAAIATSNAARTFADAPSNQLRVAILGVNGRAKAHIKALAKQKDVRIAMLCDPDAKVLEARAAELKAQGITVETAADMRKVYERKDIDAVTVATPNHWHALATIWGCQAGKDVYVEKPGAHNLFEGRKMVEAAKKYGRIVQHGVQLRSSPAVREAVDHLRNGTIGDVYLARGLCFRKRDSIGIQKPSSPPPNLNWDLWQGPATERQFSKRYVHYNWHWHWDYGNGDIGNQGVHQTDMCLWGLDVGLPNVISSMGGRFLFKDDKETPEVLSSSFYYADSNKMIEFEVRPWATNTEGGVGVGNIFFGSKGYMLINGYNSYEIYLNEPPKSAASASKDAKKKEKKGAPGPAFAKKDGDPLPAHFANWIAAIRARKPEMLHGPVETAHTSSALAHLGNIAFRLGRRIHFDPVKERFVGDSEAEPMLTREYRAPYVVPDVV